MSINFFVHLTILTIIIKQYNQIYITSKQSSFIYYVKDACFRTCIVLQHQTIIYIICAMSQKIQDMMRSQNQLNQCILSLQMKSQQALANNWGAWLSFSSGNKLQASYQSNLIKLHQVKNWADFAYIWTQSSIKNPSIYFADPFTGEYTKLQIKGEFRKIESINFFKDDIEPTWQYGNNAKGGYYNFSISKQSTQQTMQQVYETLIFMAIGETLDISKYLNGVRIVDTSGKKKFRCRFQLWVNYQDDDENLDMIKVHAESVQKLIEGANFKLADIKFFNIGAKIEQLQKNDKSTNNEVK